MDKAGKEQILGEIKEAFANVASVVLADYRGIDVPDGHRDPRRLPQGRLPLPGAQELAGQDRGQGLEDGADERRCSPARPR